MVITARQACLSVSETDLDWIHTIIYRVYGELSKKRKYLVSSSSPGEVTLLMSEDRENGKTAFT